MTNVSMHFGPHLVLQDVDVTVRDGEFVSLIGVSGCGKTTLLNTIAGFLAPTTGYVAVNGKRVYRPGPDRSMIFQDDAVFPWYTVADNVGYGLRFRKLPSAIKRQRVEELVNLVGLHEAEHRYPRQLSGGMRKRVDIARALAVEPQILLMDEPFAALDAITKLRLQTEFLRIWDQTRMTVVFVTHDIEEALFMSDRVLLMSSAPGRVVLERNVPFERPRADALRTSPELQEVREELREALQEQLGPIGVEV